jgi:hypothetical protein
MLEFEIEPQKWQKIIKTATLNEQAEYNQALIRKKHMLVGGFDSSRALAVIASFNNKFFKNLDDDNEYDIFLFKIYEKPLKNGFKDDTMTVKFTDKKMVYEGENGENYHKPIKTPTDHKSFTIGKPRLIPGIGTVTDKINEDVLVKFKVEDLSFPAGDSIIFKVVEGKMTIEVLNMDGEGKEGGSYGKTIVPIEAYTYEGKDEKPKFNNAETLISYEYFSAIQKLFKEEVWLLIEHKSILALIHSDTEMSRSFLISPLLTDEELDETDTEEWKKFDECKGCGYDKADVNPDTKLCPDCTTKEGSVEEKTKIEEEPLISDTEDDLDDFLNEENDDLPLIEEEIEEENKPVEQPKTPKKPTTKKKAAAKKKNSKKK